MTLLSCTNLALAVFVLILASAVKNLYTLLNPLDGIEVRGPTVDPLWQENQAFDMLCYLSSSSRFKHINTTELRQSGRILFEKSQLRHKHSQQELRINLLVSSSATTTATEIENEETVHFIAPSSFWEQIHSNKSALYMHVVLTRRSDQSSSSSSVISSSSDVLEVVDAKAIKAGAALHGAVQLVKYDKLPKSFQQRHLLADFGLVQPTIEEVYRLSLHKETIISYWKPEVAVRLVNEFSKYPYDYVPLAMHENLIYVSGKQPPARYRLASEDPSGDLPVTWAHYKPSIHVDEIGLTSDKYVPLNSSVAELPLTISFGPLSVQRWLLMSHLADSIDAQSEFGFTDKDIDDVRRLITDTSLLLLALTMLASVLHLIFEMFAIKSDIEFWQLNTSLAGLSARSVITELLSQCVVFLFLLDSDTSLLVLAPAFAGILVQAWKVRKATGFEIKFGTLCLPIGIAFSRWQSENNSCNSIGDSNSNSSDDGSDISSSNTGAVIEATDKTNKPSEQQQQKQQQQQLDELTRVTLEADRFATVYLSAALLPLVLLFTLRSLLYEKHISWYSWCIGALTGCVYTFGFILMVPQLYINHRLKSVSHLPWNFLVYKFLNTFIDDLFAFVIKMPTMHRLSVFRDDIVFLIYLYQRWIYRIDTSRPGEK